MHLHSGKRLNYEVINVESQTEGNSLKKLPKAKTLACLSYRCTLSAQNMSVVTPSFSFSFLMALESSEAGI